MKAESIAVYFYFIVCPFALFVDILTGKKSIQRFLFHVWNDSIEQIASDQNRTDKKKTLIHYYRGKGHINSSLDR